ncbi:uncharacterized protein V6R79_020096 [Siganus canaliculatus]
MSPKEGSHDSSAMDMTPNTTVSSQSTQRHEPSGSSHIFVLLDVCLCFQLTLPRKDSSDNARKRKWESEEEELRKRSRETVNLSQGPSQQTYQDSHTVKTNNKRKLEETEEHIKRIKLSPRPEDKSEDLSSDSSSNSSCSSDDDRRSLKTDEDLSRDSPKSVCFVISNKQSSSLDNERHELSFSEEDEENSSTPLNTGKEKHTSGSKRFAAPCEGTSDGSVTALTSSDRNSRILFEATYMKEEMIGRGAYGSVFAGYRKLDQLPVAIKQIPCEGITYAMIVIQQLVDAFAEIHSRGVLHRDIHFKNILVELGSVVPRIRIIDFGCGLFLKSGENKDSLTVLQIADLLYNMLPVSPFTCPDLTEDCLDFFSACEMMLPERRPSLRELQNHPWLTRQNSANDES